MRIFAGGRAWHDLPCVIATPRLPHHHASRHERMHRADVIIRSRLVEGAAEACSRQQWIYALGAILVAKPVRGAVVIHPSNGFPCGDRKRGGCERKVGDGDSRAAGGCEHSRLHDDLARRGAHGDLSFLPGPEIDDRHIIRAFVRDVNLLSIVGRLPMRLIAHGDGAYLLLRVRIEQLQFDPTTKKQVRAIAVGNQPHWQASNDGKKVYVTNEGSNDVTVVDLGTGQKTTIPVGTAPRKDVVQPPTPASIGGARISIAQFPLPPAPLSVAAKETVTWGNNDGAPHGLGYKDGAQGGNPF